MENGTRSKASSASSSATWDAVIKRNSNLKNQPLLVEEDEEEQLNNDVIILKRPTKFNNNEVDEDDEECPIRSSDSSSFPNELTSPPRLLFQDPSCNDQTGWMDFLQILVHQHAKTIVQLQDLQCEVEKLKDFRSSFISSITGELNKTSTSTGPPHSSVSHLHHLPSTKQDVWTSSPNKLIDSGFSTETKESNNQKDDDDPLYSLLDLIQTKVSNSTTANPNFVSSACTCSNSKPVNNGTRSSANNLGRLDKILKFKEGISNQAQNVDKSLIGAILREIDVLELQRQLIFAAVKIKGLELQSSGSSGNDLESRNPNRLLSKYHALSHENEQLRFKLKEQEIQLEGTKAKLRILERNSHAASIIVPSIISQTSKPLLTPPEPYPRIHRKANGINSSSSNLNLLVNSNGTYHSNNKSPIPIIPSPISISPGAESNHHINTPNSHNNIHNPSHSSLSPSSLNSSFSNSSPSPSGNLRGSSTSFLPRSSSTNNKLNIDNRLPPKRYTNLNNYLVAPNPKNLNLSHSVSQIDLGDSKSRVVPLKEQSNSHVAGNNKNISSLSPNTKPIQRTIVSRIPTRPQTPRKIGAGNGTVTSTNNSLTTPPHSQFLSTCKSPSSSMSSKSSIPVPIARLKRNNSGASNSNSNGTSASKKTGGLWGWFTTS